MTEADLSNKGLGAGGAIVVAAWISHRDKRAMTRLNLSKNRLLTQEGGRALGDMLKASTILKELDVSYNMPDRSSDGPGFATAISDGLTGNGALMSLNLAGNDLGQLVLPEGWSGPDCNDEYEDPDGEYHQQAPAGSKPEGIIVLANAIKDMGAMTSLNLASNDLRIEGAKIVAVVLPKCM
jgi:hypothetical protein